MGDLISKEKLLEAMHINLGALIERRSHYTITKDADGIQTKQAQIDLMDSWIMHIRNNEFDAEPFFPDENAIKVYILRYWKRDQIEAFAKHLIGDRCNGCGPDHVHAIASGFGKAEPAPDTGERTCENCKLQYEFLVDSLTIKCRGCFPPGRKSWQPREAKSTIRENLTVERGCKTCGANKQECGGIIVTDPESDDCVDWKPREAKEQGYGQGVRDACQCAAMPNGTKCRFCQAKVKEQGE